MIVSVDVWYTPIAKQYEIDGYENMTDQEKEIAISNIVSKDEEFVGRENVTWIVTS